MSEDKIFKRDYRGKADEKRKVDAKEIISAIKNGFEIEIDCAIIEGKIELQNIVIERPISFTECSIDEVCFIEVLFKKEVNFSQNIFNGYVNFSLLERDKLEIKSCVFEDKVYFLHSEFKNFVFFIGVQFKSDTYFNQAIFQKDLYFSLAAISQQKIKNSKSKIITIFEADAYFIGSKFKAIAIFAEVIFKSNAFFIESVFDKNVFFGASSDALSQVQKSIEVKSAAFEKTAYFERATFRGVANFIKVYFNDKAIFNQAVFLNNANFTNALFGKDANFVEAQIKHQANFEKSVFKGKSCFNGIHISRGACFKDAIFDNSNYQEENTKDLKEVIYNDFNNAYFEQYAQFENTIFKKECSFNNSKIDGWIRFNNSIFEDEASFLGINIKKTAEFETIQFYSMVKFDRSSIAETATFKEAEFRGELYFIAVKIGSNAQFEKAKFSNSAYFQRMKVVDNADFKKAEFYEADFQNAQIEGSASFNGSIFNQKANFNGISVKEDFSFCKIDRYEHKYEAAIFKEEASFINAKVGLKTEFNQVTFDKKAIFDGIECETSFFAHNAIFNGEANFNSSKIDGNAEFQSSKFYQKANFQLIQVNNAFFKYCEFYSEVDFVAAKIENFIDFRQSTFELRPYGSSQFSFMCKFLLLYYEKSQIFLEKYILKIFLKHNQIPGNIFCVMSIVVYWRIINFLINKYLYDLHFLKEFSCKILLNYLKENRVKFNYAKIGCNAWFNNVKFISYVDFSNCYIGSTLDFSYTHFKYNLNLKYIKCQTIKFEENINIEGTIRLQGAEYQNIESKDSQSKIAWESLLEKLYPYQQQPYEHLEKIFFRSGLESEAKEVYYKRKIKEHEKNIDSISKQKRGFNRIIPLIGSKLWDRLKRYSTGYGVKVNQIWCTILLIWITGCCIFSNESSYFVAPPSPQPKSTICSPCWISLDFLLPIVKLPTVDRCVPTHKPILKKIPAMEKHNFVKKELIKIPVINTMSFADFAILETVVGWLLIPVGIAGLTGVLKR